MNTKSKSVLILAVAFSAASFTNIMKKEIKTSESKIEWTGKKVLGKHNGTIDFKEGHLEFDGETLVGGEFVVDMTTIAVTDLEGESKGQLEGHLNSDDFFGIANYKTATLKITNAEKTAAGYSVVADLTIKEETHPVEFDLAIDGDTATTSFQVNRTKYGVRYGSGSFFDNLGDNTISDNFTLDVTLKF